MLVSQNENFISDKIQTALLNSPTIRLKNECYFPLRWSKRWQGKIGTFHITCAVLLPLSHKKSSNTNESPNPLWAPNGWKKLCLAFRWIHGCIKPTLSFPQGAYNLGNDTHEKNMKNMNTKVTGYVTYHVKRGYFVALCEAIISLLGTLTCMINVPDNHKVYHTSYIFSPCLEYTL